jgi:hypothetical protein
MIIPKEQSKWTDPMLSTMNSSAQPTKQYES